MSIVWRDKVLSSYNGNIESVVVHDGAGEKEVPNGVFVTLDGLIKGKGREVKKAVLATDPTADVLLVSTPEVLYEAGKEIDDFVNEKGHVARAFRLADGDVISMTEDLLNTAPTGEGREVFVVGTGGKLAPIGETAEADVAVKFVVREDAGRELHRTKQAWRFDVVK